MNIFFKFMLLCLVITQSLFSNQINLTKEEINWLNRNPQITVGEGIEFEPLLIQNNDGTISGLTPELYDLIAKKIGIEFKYVPSQWSKVLERVESKEIDFVSSMNKNVAIAKGLIPIDAPFNQTTTIFAKKNRNFEILKDEDIKNLRIAYFHEILYIDSYLKSLKDDVKLVKTNNSLSALEKVMSGEADIAIGLNIDSYMITKNLLMELEPIYTFESLKVDAVLGVRPDYKIFATILQKAINTISSEEKNKIINKWLWVSSKLENKIGLTKKEIEYLEQKTSLKVQTLSTFPPFNFSKNSIPTGYTIDYMKLIGEYLNTNIEFTQAKPFAETITMFKEGKIDILPHIAVNESRKEFINYTNFNHIEYSLGITVRKNDEIKHIDDLEDRVIAVINKSFIHTYMKKNFPDYELLALSSTSQCVEAISLGKADAFLGSIPTMNFYIQKNWLSNVKTTKIDGLSLSQKVKMPMGVQKGNELLKSILEKVNLHIPHNEIIKLKQKWLNLDVTDSSNLLLTEKEKNYLIKKEKIKMCVLPNWLPFEQIDENGQHKGIGADIITIISKKLEIPFELVHTNEWAESLKNIRDRKCDILPVAMDVPSRRDAMNFTHAYDKEPFVIATKSDALFIKDSSEIGNRKIGIVKSYAFIEVLKQRNPGIQIVSVKNAEDGLERVRSGELFGYVDIIPAIIYTMQQNSLVDLKISGKLEFDIKLSMASRNDEPLLNTILQKSLNTIGEDKIKSIVGNWLSVKLDQRVDYTLLWQISLFFLLIILVVLYKNREVSSLNKKLLTATKEIQDRQIMVDKYVMILTTNLEGQILDLNEAYCNTIGYRREELVGSNHGVIRHPDMTKEFFKNLWATISINETWTGEIKNLTKDKKTLYFHVIIEPLIKNGQKVGYRSIAKDITDKKRIEELSVTDKLTKLYNRLKIDELLLKQVNIFKRYNVPFSIILFDVDNFKSINDNFGHDVGDFVLEKISKISKDSIRKTDEIGRWGGEEFIIICTNTNNEEASILAEHLRTGLLTSDFGKVGKVTISLGVSSFNSSDNISTIFKRVDKALYKAKKDGKNRTISL